MLEKFYALKPMVIHIKNLLQPEKLLLLVKRGLLGFLILMGVGYFILGIYQDTTSLKPNKRPNKQIELFYSDLTGYKDGKISWQVKADYIWTGRSRYLYRVEEIQSGQIYNKKEELILDHIQAQEIKVNSNTRIFQALGGISAVFKRQTKTESGTELRDVDISAGEMAFYETSNRTIIKDNVRMVQGDMVILPKSDVVVDHDHDLVKIDGGLTLEDDDVFMEGEELIIHINDDKGELSGGVKGYRKARHYPDSGLDEREVKLRNSQTDLSAGKLVITEQEGLRRIGLEDNVVISQDGKLLKADEAFFSESDDQYMIFGNVEVTFSDLDWLIDKEKKKDFDNEDTASSVYSTTIIKSDKLQFDAEKFEVKIIGDVRIEQPDKVITARKLIYEDATGDLLLYGSVKVDREDKDTIWADELRINIYNEEVFADGEVVTEFEIN